MAYNHFAYVYDRLMEHAPYDEWVTFTEHAIRLHKKEVQSILDLGCGTGRIAVQLAKEGYEVTGVDHSSEMLARAFDRALASKAKVDWVHQDIRKLKGFSNFDLAISYCDVMNYVTEKKDLKSFFCRVYDSLRIGGLFIFDIHSLSYAEQSLADRTFADASADIAYIWECEKGDSPGEMFHHLTFFQQKIEDTYVRFDEMHHQRTYEIGVYKQLLNACNFHKISFFADFRLENDFSEKNSERIFIIAEK